MLEVPQAFPHCDDVGHLIKKITHEDGTTSGHCMRTVHAEQSAICQAAKRGVSLEGSTCLCDNNTLPYMHDASYQHWCKKNSSRKKYQRGEESEEMLKKAGIKLEFLNNETLKYPSKN